MSKPAVIKYLLFWPLNILSILAAFVLAPVAALPVFVRSTPPRGVYGDPRPGEWLVQGWAWITTHDAHVDQYAYGSMGRKHWLLKRFNTEMPELNPGWLRYANRVLWIWRNPAYFVKHHWLGLHKDDPGIFLFERNFRHLHVQFGWKVYRNDPDGKRMYAFRLKPEFKEGWS